MKVLLAVGGGAIVIVGVAAAVVMGKISEPSGAATPQAAADRGRDQCREFTLSLVQRQKGWFLELATPQPGGPEPAATDR